MLCSVLRPTTFQITSVLCSWSVFCIKSFHLQLSIMLMLVDKTPNGGQNLKSSLAFWEMHLVTLARWDDQYSCLRNCGAGASSWLAYSRLAWNVNTEGTQLVQAEPDRLANAYVNRWVFSKRKLKPQIIFTNVGVQPACFLQMVM